MNIEEILKELMGDAYKEDMSKNDVSAFFKKQVLSTGNYENVDKSKAEKKELNDKIAELQAQLEERMSDDDKKKKEEADTKNDAEQVIFMTEKALKDLGDKVTDKDKEEAEDLIKETKKALEGDDLEEIKKAKDKLLGKANELATKVYEEAAKNNQKEETSEETKEDKKDDDNVVDADYEEK